MSDHHSKSGENLPVAVVTVLAGIVGVLIMVQMIRAQPLDLFSMLLIAVCFVVAVVTTAVWSKRSGR